MLLHPRAKYPRGFLAKEIAVLHRLVTVRGEDIRDRLRCRKSNLATANYLRFVRVRAKTTGRQRPGGFHHRQQCGELQQNSVTYRLRKILHRSLRMRQDRRWFCVAWQKDNSRLRNLQRRWLAVQRLPDLVVQRLGLIE